jgi:hypothetical protein
MIEKENKITERMKKTEREENIKKKKKNRKCKPNMGEGDTFFEER